jgi:hypothetical protein
MKRRHFFKGIVGLFVGIAAGMKPPATITFQLDREVIGRLMREDINALIRKQGFILRVK